MKPAAAAASPRKSLKPCTDKTPRGLLTFATPRMRFVLSRLSKQHKPSDTSPRTDSSLGFRHMAANATSMIEPCSKKPESPGSKTARSKKKTVKIDLTLLGARNNYRSAQQQHAPGSPGSFSARLGSIAQKAEDVEEPDEQGEGVPKKVQVMTVNRRGKCYETNRMPIGQYISESGPSMKKSTSVSLLAKEVYHELKVVSRANPNTPASPRDTECKHNVPPTARSRDMNQYLNNIKCVAAKPSKMVSVMDKYKKNMLEGYLMKKKAGLMPTWKSKYCVLKRKCFVYYAAKGDSKVKGCVQFGTVSCKLVHEPRSNRFEYLPTVLIGGRLVLAGCPKKMQFMHSNSELIQEWVAALHGEIKTASSPPGPVPCLKFWKASSLSA